MEKIHLISESFRHLREDFLGFSFRPELFFQQILYFSFVLFLFYLMFGVGKFINRLFFEKSYDKVLHVFVDFSLGYFILGSSIFCLGLFGILTSTNVVLLLLFFLGVSLFELVKNPIKINLSSLVPKKNIYKFLSFCFLMIAFLRLIPPQSAGDPLDYHLRFPRIYLDTHTMMIPPLGDESYTTVPHLPELIYIPTQIVSNGLMSHVVHFGFFVLVFLFLYNINLIYKKQKEVGPLSGLMFLSAPLMLQLGTQAFSDFPALFCFMVAISMLLLGHLNARKLIVSGVLIGVALASKIWIIYYFPFVALFIFIISRSSFGKKVKNAFIFSISAFVIVAPWYIRGYLLAGNPFYINTSQGQITQSYSLTENFMRNFTLTGFSEKFHFSFEYGVVIYIGLLALVFTFSKIKKNIDKKFSLLFLVLLIPALLFPIPFWQGRYSLPYMLLAFMIAGLSLGYLFKYTYAKWGLFIILLILSLYYLLNTVIILPYGLGWANKDSYLRRNLVMDTATYYDYNGQFTKAISRDETITNYGLFELYYAHFKYKNVFYFINQKTHIFKLSKDIKKILIRGGDFEWFCKNLSIKNCSEYKVTLITHDLYAKQYLYNIRYVLK